MKIGLIYKSDNKKATLLLTKIANYIKKSGYEVVSEKNISESEYIITLGGDGTLIHTACKYAQYEIPVLGINTGNLGFLTASESVDWKLAVDNLLSKKIVLSQRITLEAEVDGKIYRAVNEVVIKSHFRVVNLDLSVSGTNFLKVSGDGLIVATQTGSTAYSLSAGGSIIDADLNCLVLTPINPIGLPVPSVVLSPDEVVEVVITGGDSASLIIDGQGNMKLNPRGKIKFKRGKYDVKFVYFNKKQIFRSLNMKFGLSARSAGV